MLTPLEAAYKKAHYEIGLIEKLYQKWIMASKEGHDDEGNDPFYLEGEARGWPFQFLVKYGWSDPRDPPSSGGVLFQMVLAYGPTEVKITGRLSREGEVLRGWRVYVRGENTKTLRVTDFEDSKLTALKWFLSQFKVIVH